MPTDPNVAATEAPIGAFDSGIGGLSVARSLMVQLPNESLIYVADSAHCPYGSRAPDEITSFALAMAEWLITQGVKLIVVACNTVSAVALGALRAAYPQAPFVGMVPAVKPAVAATRSGVVGVLATPTTLASRPYRQVLERYAGQVKVLSQPCPGLADQVEAGDLDGPRTIALVRGFTEPLLADGADVLVLGCSHYPFLLPAFRRVVGTKVQLIEPSGAIARQARRVLAAQGLMRRGTDSPEVQFATTGDPAKLAQALGRLLGYQQHVRALRWVGERLEG